MSRYTKYATLKGGWTAWVQPVSRGYKMACCDCGLVHNFEFRIDAIGQINFRAKRNARSTAQMRRHRKEKEPAE